MPYLLFGLVLGAVVDRFDRRRMMLLTDLARAAVIVVLPLLALSGALRVQAIYAVAFRVIRLQRPSSSLGSHAAAQVRAP